MGRFSHRYTELPINTPLLTILGIGVHDCVNDTLQLDVTAEPHYLLLLCHTAVTLHREGDTIEMLPGTCVVCSSASLRALGDAGTTWEYSWLACRGTFILEQLTLFRIALDTPYHLTSATYLDEILLALDQECFSGNRADPIRFVHLLQDGFTVLHRQLYVPRDPQRISDLVLDAKQYLETHSTEVIRLPQLAELAHISVPHLSREFNKHCALSPMAYLQQIRMRHALLLLSSTRFTVSAIAVAVGYESLPHFLQLFHKHYGVTPRQLRATLTGKPVKRTAEASTQSLTLERWLREGWQLVANIDFTKTQQLDPRFKVYFRNDDPVPGTPVATTQHYLSLTPTHLELLPHDSSTTLCWEEELIEETKIEVDVLNTLPEGVNLTLAISGDTQTGYRLRIHGFDHLELETLARGSWERLFHCQYHLSPREQQYHIVFWRSENTFYAEVNGKLIMEYYDPLAPLGPQHRTVAIARLRRHGATCLRHIRLFTRKLPRYVDSLDRGRALLHLGHLDEAYAWFQRIYREHDDSTMRQEALFLSAMALPERNNAEKIALLQQIAGDAKQPFRQQSFLRLLALYCERGEVENAIACTVHFYQDTPEDFLLSDVISKICKCLCLLTPAQVDTALRQLAPLSIDSLDLNDVPLASFAPLVHQPLKQLSVTGEQIHDLRLLCSMPLEKLSFMHTSVSDITPLAGLALKELYCQHNHIIDLSPLQQMPLTLLNCAHNRLTHLTHLQHIPLHSLLCGNNAIDDLTPLSNMPLRHLSLPGNLVSDLSPLSATPINELDCSSNRIQTLEPLRNVPLRYLRCAHNAITDLSPLAHLPLYELHCEGNKISDLSPLQDIPLHILSCGDNPITDLTPLTGLPLSTISLTNIPVDSEQSARVLASFPLLHLQCPPTSGMLMQILASHPHAPGYNHHTNAYVRPLLPALQQALQAWRSGESYHNAYDLRAYATCIEAVDYLALPVRMTWHEALAFARWQQGTLVSPDTPQRYLCLQRYIQTIVMQDERPRYHVGLSRAAGDEFTWTSGARCDWHLATSAEAAAGVWMWGGLTTLSAGAWAGNTPTSQSYVFFEWQDK